MSRVLVTGLDGFTGRYLAPLLADHGHEVHGLTHHALEPTIAGAAMHRGDLADRDGLRVVVERVRPEKVVHLAGIAFVAHDDVDAIYQTNLIGTRNLLAALAEVGSAQAVLLLSSANVYGIGAIEPIDESFTPAPVSDYAVSKLAMEWVARIYADRLPIIVARPFNYTGVGQSNSFLIPKIVDHFRRRVGRIELGNLDVARDFSDVRDVAATFAALIENPAAIGGTFNVCSGRAWSLGEVIAMAEEATGHRLDVGVNPALVRDNEVKMLRGSRAALDAVLGQRPLRGLDETLRWMLTAGA